MFPIGEAGRSGAELIFPVNRERIALEEMPVIDETDDVLELEISRW
jgi:hypothetical protein